MNHNNYRRLLSLILIFVFVFLSIQLTDVQANAKASPLFASGNDSFGGAISINSDNFNDTGDITNDTEDGTDPAAISCGGPLYQTVWYEFTPASDGSLTLDMSGSSGNTAIVVVTGSPSSFTEVDCGSVLALDYYGYLSNLAVTSGTQYFIMIGSPAADGSTFSLSSTFVSDPSSNRYSNRNTD